MRAGIVLSGGGAKGAFEVGALNVLLHYFVKNDIQLAAIAGTSIGAFNAAFVASGQFYELGEIWDKWDKHTCDFTQTGLLPAPLSLLLNGYVYETPYSFLKERLNVEALMASKIRYINTSVCLADGEMYIGGNANPSKSDDTVLREILASASPIPLTQSVRIGSEEYVDGGFRDTVPVKALLNNCGEKLDVIYVVSVNPQKRIWSPALELNGSKGLMSRLSFVFDGVLWDEALRNDIDMGRMMAPKDGSYIVIQPEVVHTTGGDFSRVRTSAARAHGIEMTLKALGV